MENAASPLRRRMPSWLPQAFGYGLSIVCLLWVLHDFPLARLGQEIRMLEWRWVMLGVAADLLTYVAHAWRWNILLNPVARLKLWRTTQAIYIGLFANEVLPLRTGELIRIYLMTHWNNLRLSVGFASAGVERLVDGVWMVISFVITASFVSGIPPQLVLLVQVLGVLIVLGAGALLWVARRKHEPQAVLSENKWSAAIRHITEGLQLMGNPRTLIAMSLVSLLYLVLQFVTVWALIKAAHFDYSFWVASGVITLVRFAVVIPNAPGNLGVFQAAFVKALELFDAQEQDAKGFAFIMWFALTLPLLIGGAVATALTGVKIGELRERAKREVSDVAPSNL
jgi:glycosyltransferase 2 family protein